MWGRDGLTGKGFDKLKDHLCDKGVEAAAAYITAQSGGAGAAVGLGTPYATEKCMDL